MCVLVCCRRGRVHGRHQQLPAPAAAVGRAGAAHGAAHAHAAPGRALRQPRRAAGAVPERLQVQHGHAAVERQVN